MPRFFADLSLLFPELSFQDLFKAVAAAGFRGVEFLLPAEDLPLGRIGDLVAANGLQAVLIERGWNGLW